MNVWQNGKCGKVSIAAVTPSVVPTRVSRKVFSNVVTYRNCEIAIARWFAAPSFGLWLTQKYSRGYRADHVLGQARIPLLAHREFIEFLA